MVGPVASLSFRDLHYQSTDAPSLVLGCIPNPHESQHRQIAHLSHHLPLLDVVQCFGISSSDRMITEGPRNVIRPHRATFHVLSRRQLLGVGLRACEKASHYGPRGPRTSSGTSHLPGHSFNSFIALIPGGAVGWLSRTATLHNSYLVLQVEIVTLGKTVTLLSQVASAHATSSWKTRLYSKMNSVSRIRIRRKSISTS
jgi:hypothetical protein